MARVKRSAGRRPLDPDDPSVSVSIKIPSKQFDEFCRRARRDQVSVPEIIRRRLRAAPASEGGA